MAAFTLDQFAAIERAVHAAESAAAALGAQKQLRDDLKSASYLMSVIRAHAALYANAEADTDNAEMGLSLLSALYR